MLLFVLWNRLKISYFRTKFLRIKEGFYSNNKVLSNEKFLIDLSNLRNEHFGDQLFFIFSIIRLSNFKNFTFKVDSKWKDLYDLFNLRTSEQSFKSFNRNEVSLVTTFRSFVDLKDKKYFREIIIFDSMDKEISSPFCEEIFNFFSKEKNVSFHDTLSLKFNGLKVSNKLEEILKSEFYIFNDAIYSRSFIRPFLIRSLFKFLESNFCLPKRIIQVGSKDDLNKNSFKLPIDTLFDLRGKISLKELFFVLSHENCKGYIGFDNAIMHIALFFKKKAFVKFRGRFSKQNRDFHYKCVNCAVGEYAKSNIEYIK